MYMHIILDTNFYNSLYYMPLFATFTMKLVLFFL